MPPQKKPGFPRGTRARAAAAAPAFTEHHPNLRHPAHAPTRIGHIVSGLSEEARALMFVIFTLACLLLAGSIVVLFLRPEPSRPTAAQQRSVVDESVRQSPNAVPET